MCTLCNGSKKLLMLDLFVDCDCVSAPVPANQQSNDSIKQESKEDSICEICNSVFCSEEANDDICDDCYVEDDDDEDDDDDYYDDEDDDDDY